LIDYAIEIVINIFVWWNYCWGFYVTLQNWGFCGTPEGDLG